MREDPYLTFSGNCREAMTFYKKCLGRKLSFQTIGDTPRSAKMPEKMKQAVLHSALTKGDFVLMAPDLSDKQLQKGNNVSLMLLCDNEKDLKNYYKKLSAGAKKSNPSHVPPGIP